MKDYFDATIVSLNIQVKFLILVMLHPAAVKRV